MENKMKKYWDNRAKNYDLLFNRSPIRLEVMEQILKLSPKSVNRILDIGAGTGRLTEYLLTYYPNAEFHLLDLSPQMLVCAKERFCYNSNIHFYESSFEKLPFPKDSFDLVVSAFALHHAENKAKLNTAKEVYRVLHSGGVGVIADEIMEVTEMPDEFNQKMIQTFYPFEKKNFFNQTFSDIQEFPVSLRDLESFFEKAGFSVTSFQVNDIVGIIKVDK